MDHIYVPRKSWVVVCNLSKALTYCNEGSPDSIKLKLLDVFVHPAPPTRSLGADRPGRVYQSHGPARSSVEEADRQLEAETAFLSDVSGKLDSAVRDQLVDKIVLMASPKALGILRSQLQPATRDAIVAEFSKDLAHMPTAEIERHLSG
jgi:protein required for attachment to host cells